MDPCSVLRSYHRFSELTSRPALNISDSMTQCEMVISNIGTIAESLPASNDRPTSSKGHAGSSAALQVKLLSITNTASRLIIGPLADYVSPISVFLPTGIRTFTRKHMISRFAFLTGAAALVSLTFFWMSIGITTQGELWALRYLPMSYCPCFH